MIGSPRVKGTDPVQMEVQFWCMVLYAMKLLVEIHYISGMYQLESSVVCGCFDPFLLGSRVGQETKGVFQEHPLQ